MKDYFLRFSFWILILEIFGPLNLKAQVASKKIPLWKTGAPGFESRKNEKEISKDYWVRNIHNPSLTVFEPPLNRKNGTAILLCPGGGHRLLVWTSEGIEPAQYLNSLGITVFILKYRLGRDSLSPYKVEIHAREDGIRAMQSIRSMAKDYKIDPHKIGMMGFSAGGEVVSMVSFGDNSNILKIDSIDRVDYHPNFIIQVYPGPLFIPDTIPASSPPAFLVAANDDPCCSTSILKILEKYRQKKLPVEIHLFSKGSHAFNMGSRSLLKSIHDWPNRLRDWLLDNQFITPELNH